MPHPTARASLLSLALALCAACSATPPPKVALDAPEVAAEEAVDPGPSYCEQEIGGMNEEAVDAVFASLSGPVERCVREGSARLDALGGSFKLSLRIDRQGAPKWVYLRESTLGDRATETCLLDAARAKRWPRPLGGEGLAEKTFEIDPVATSATLDPKRVRSSVALASKHTASCRKGIDGTFLATAYLQRDGRVLSAGVAPPSEQGEEVADCVVDAIRKLRFSGGRPSPSKVSFEIR